jgi:hypothetical protein
MSAIPSFLKRSVLAALLNNRPPRPPRASRCVGISGPGRCRSGMFVVSGINLWHWSAFRGVARRLLATMFAIVAVSAANAVAQTYPSKPVTIVVPFPAGGPVDTRGRSAEHLRLSLGQPIIIESSGQRQLIERGRQVGEELGVEAPRASLMALLCRVSPDAMSSDAVGRYTFWLEVRTEKSRW